jgi:hypothetical protein
MTAGSASTAGAVIHPGRYTAPPVAASRGAGRITSDVTWATGVPSGAVMDTRTVSVPDGDTRTRSAVAPAA